MFDSVALKHVLPKPPSETQLRYLGWYPRFNSFDGLCYKWICNEPNRKHYPHLTLSFDHERLAHLRAEVSIPAVLHGSNVILPKESDIDKFLTNISNYVTERTQITFNARTAKVTRIDFTRDIQIGNTNISSCLLNLSRISLPRFRQIIYDYKTVEYRNKGQRLSKK